MGRALLMTIGTLGAQALGKRARPRTHFLLTLTLLLAWEPGHFAVAVRPRLPVAPPPPPQIYRVEAIRAAKRTEEVVR